MASNNLTGFATNANVSGMVEYFVSADQLPPASLVHTANAPRANHLSPSRQISGSNILVHRKEAASVELHFMIGNSDVF